LWETTWEILDLARFDKRITGKRKALGQSGIESVIKGGLLRSLFHFIGVMCSSSDPI